jgi:hypothetical protein
MRTIKLTIPSVLLGLLALSIAPSALATQTQCSGSLPTLLDNTLINTFGVQGGEDGCSVGGSHEDEDGEHDYREHHDGFPGGDGNWQWHDGKDGKDGKDGRDCNPPVVPLPPSSLLLASGVVALLAVGRRRRPATA